MKPVLYRETETEFVSNGLGRLSDAIKCRVVEERNGQYELELTYPITGIHYDDLKEERIICARHDDTGDVQPFRIYKITRPMNGKVTVNARHISYQLSKVVVMPMSAESCVEALTGMKEKGVGDNPFSVWTDKTLAAHFEITQPVSFRSQLGGVAGSILDVYGPGEYEWDKYTVKFHANRGYDSGVTLRYGKNLTDLKKTSDTSNIWTGIVPFWAGTVEGSDDTVVVTLPEEVLYTSTADQYAFRMVVPVDLSSKFENQPTVAQLRSAARSYLTANVEMGIPTTIDVSFIALWQTEEYKAVAPLQRLRLCDTVTVHHKGLGISHKAKIVSVTYDVLLERYETMTIGNVHTNLSDSIRSVADEVRREIPSMSAIDIAVKKATKTIIGGTGGHVIMKLNADGKPEEILAMDSEDAAEAMKVLRINMNGIGFSTTGINGPFRTAWTIDGNFVADYITTGNLNASLITTGELTANLIKTGTMLADRIQGGTLTLGGSNNANGLLKILNASGTEIGRWDKDGIQMLAGIINLANKFVVSSSGAVSAKSLTATDFVYVNGGSGSRLKIPIYRNGYIDIGSDGITINCYAKYFEETLDSMSDGSILFGTNDQYYNLGTNPGPIQVTQKGRYTNIGGGWITIDSTSSPAVATEVEIFPERQLLTRVFSDYLYSAGDLTCRGTKSRQADTDNYGQRLLYCYEMASPIFGDIGEGVLDENGECIVSIDDIFSETARTDISYQVFLQKEGAGDLWVSDKTDACFVVRGTPGLPFAWELKAKQTGYETNRLEAEDLYDRSAEDFWDSYSDEREESIKNPFDLYSNEGKESTSLFELYAEELKSQRDETELTQEETIENERD